MADQLPAGWRFDDEPAPTAAAAPTLPQGWRFADEPAPDVPLPPRRPDDINALPDNPPPNNPPMPSARPAELGSSYDDAGQFPSAPGPGSLSQPAHGGWALDPVGGRISPEQGQIEHDAKVAAARDAYVKARQEAADAHANIDAVNAANANPSGIPSFDSGAGSPPLSGEDLAALAEDRHTAAADALVALTRQPNPTITPGRQAAEAAVNAAGKTVTSVADLAGKVDRDLWGHPWLSEKVKGANESIDSAFAGDAGRSDETGTKVASAIGGMAPLLPLAAWSPVVAAGFAGAQGANSAYESTEATQDDKRRPSVDLTDAERENLSLATAAKYPNASPAERQARFTADATSLLRRKQFDAEQNEATDEKQGVRGTQLTAQDYADIRERVQKQNPKASENQLGDLMFKSARDLEHSKELTNRWLSAIGGGAIGTAQMLPFSRLIGRMEAMAPGSIVGTVKNAAEQGIHTSVEQVVVQGLSQIGDNGIKKLFADKDQSLIEGVAESAQIAAIVGGALGIGGVAFNSATARQGLAKSTPEEIDAFVNKAGPRTRGEEWRSEIDDFLRQQAAKEAQSAPGAPSPESPAEPAPAPKPAAAPGDTTGQSEGVASPPNGRATAQPPENESAPKAGNRGNEDNSASPSPQPGDATLKAMGWGDEEIGLMSARERARRIEEANQAGINVPDEPTGADEGLGTTAPAASENSPDAAKSGTREDPVKVDQGGDINAARDKVETDPTPAQAAAGNYRKGHITFDGLPISIENTKGSVRSGKDADGKPWSSVLPADYGYIKGSKGADGDHVDAFIGDKPPNGFAYVVDQLDPKTGKFDEHKVILGTESPSEAASLYLHAFSDGKGSQRLGAITKVPVAHLKEWLANGQNKEPIGKPAEPPPAPKPPPPPEPEPAPAPEPEKEPSFLAGLTPEERAKFFKHPDTAHAMQLGRMIDRLRESGKNDKRAEHLQTKLEGMLYAMAGKGGQQQPPKPGTGNYSEDFWRKYQEGRRRWAQQAAERAHRARADRKAQKEREKAAEKERKRQQAEWDAKAAREEAQRKAEREAMRKRHEEEDRRVEEARKKGAEAEIAEHLRQIEERAKRMEAEEAERNKAYREAAERKAEAERKAMADEAERKAEESRRAAQEKQDKHRAELEAQWEAERKKTDLLGTLKAGNPAVKLEDGRPWRIKKEGPSHIVLRMGNGIGRPNTHFRKSVSSPMWTPEFAAQRALELAKRFADGENPHGGREDDTTGDTKPDEPIDIAKPEPTKPAQNIPENIPEDAKTLSPLAQRVLDEMSKTTEQRGYIADLRKAFPDVPRAELDKALTEIHTKAPDARLMHMDNPRDKRAAESREAAVDFKGEPLHYFWVNKPSKAEQKLPDGFHMGSPEKVKSGPHKGRFGVVVRREAPFSTDTAYGDTPEAATERAHDWIKKNTLTKIGTNADGHPLFEDGRGVRSYTRDGVRITETVGINPRGEISINRGDRGPEFEPVSPKAETEPTLNPESQTDAKPEVLREPAGDVPQRERTGDPGEPAPIGPTGGLLETDGPGSLRNGGDADRPNDEQGAGAETSVPGKGKGAGGDSPRGRRDNPSRDDISDAARRGRVEAEKSLAARARKNYQITDADEIGQGGAKAKVRANIEAIRTLKEILPQERAATPEEKQKLVKFTGWGAFAQDVFGYKPEWKAEKQTLRDILTDAEYEGAKASTLNAHFTSVPVIKGMWDALEGLGFKGGRALEPAAGVGHFIGLTPKSVRSATSWTASELDPITGNIAKLLYPGADVNVTGFQDLLRPDNYFDLALSNVPFGQYAIRDRKRYKAPDLSIHDYFFVRGLDMVRPGGVAAFITSRFTMDKAAGRARDMINDRADFIGAIRLPGGRKGAFAGNAGTEVTTDIIFLRKRFPGDAAHPDSPPWTELKEIQTPDGPASINEYFADHPEQMLGTPRLSGTMYGANEFMVEPHKDTDLQAAIANAAKTFPDTLGLAPRVVRPEQPKVDPIDAENTPEGKEGALFEKDGQIFRRVQGTGQPVKMSKGDVEKVAALASMRDLVNELTGAQASGTKSNPKTRAQLQKEYKAFVDKHGPINKTVVTTSERKGKDGEPIVTTRLPNFSPFKSDPDAYKVAAIEDYDVETGKAQPAALLLRDIVAAPINRVINSPSDAMAASLDERGGLDEAYIARALDLKPDEVEHALGNLAYRNPNGGRLESAEEYLSGDVVSRLEDAIAAAKDDPSLKRNVEALKKVQPPKLSAHDISAQIGATWIPEDVYTDFLKKELGAPDKTSVKRVPVTGEWVITGENYWDVSNAQARFGTERVRVTKVIDAALNLRKITVYDKHGDDSVVNPGATEAAAIKVRELREFFAGDPEAGNDGWVWKDPARRARLEEIYNRTYNSTALRKYDGSHLSMPGMARSISRDGQAVPFELRDHQKNAIWRVVQSGNTLLAHVVGGGKTFTMVGASMELRRLGLARKPMHVIPNHMLEQYSREFLQAYPGANILVAEKDEMSRDQRRGFVAKVASGNWDAVVITHDAFGRIGISDEWQREHLGKQLKQLGDIIRELKGDKATVKELEKAKKKLETKLKDLMNAERKDAGTSFEEMGVDHLFVDEAHLFKNLSFITKMQRVKGLGQGNSQRAEDLYMKIKWLEQNKLGRSAVFATGTPISNTVAEMFTMQRYLQEPLLEQLGLETFDSWAATFGQTVENMELGADGRTFQPVTSFSKFVNIPELVGMYANVADSQTADMLNLPRPKLAGGKIKIIESEPSAEEEAAIQSLVERAAAAKGQRSVKGGDNMLKIVTEGRKIATDGRLWSNAFAFNPEGKVAKAVQNIARIYREGESSKTAKAQLVFLDMGTPQTIRKTREEGADPAANDSRLNLYADIRDRLVEAGVARNEIAFIHDAKDDAAKGRLFQRVRSGQVRVLLGSTGKMGVGTNVQKLLIALHHIDAPWKPAEVEQRDGRGLRQGNLNPEIQIYRYVTKRSFDAFMWQKLDTKSKFIGQLISGTKGSRTAEDIDNPLPEAAEMKAAASGDPRILEHAELTRKLNTLNAQKRSYEKTKSDLSWQVQLNEERLNSAPDNQGKAEKFAAKLKDVSGDNFAISIGGKNYTDRAQAGEAIKKMLLAFNTDAYKIGQNHEIELANYGGMPVQARVVRNWWQDGYYVEAKASVKDPSTGATYTAREPFVARADTNPEGFTRRLDTILSDIAHAPAFYERQRAEAQKNYDKAKADLDSLAAFPKATELTETKKRLAELTEAMQPKKEAPRKAEDAIKDAYLGITGGKRNISVPLAQIREALSHLDRATVDRGLQAILAGHPTATLMRNDDPRRLSKEDKAAAFNPHGEPFHNIWIADEPAATAAGRVGKVESDPRITPEMEKAVDDALMAAGIARRIAGEHADVKITLNKIDTPAELRRSSGDEDGNVVGLFDSETKRLLIRAATGEEKRTAFHEAFHAIDSADAFNKNERAVMDREIAAMRDHVAKAYDIPPEKLRHMPDHEVRAYHFEEYADRIEKEEPNVGSGIHIGLRRIYDKIIRFLRRLRSMLHGNGFQTREDIYERARKGEVGDRPAGPRAGSFQNGPTSAAKVKNGRKRHFERESFLDRAKRRARGLTSPRIYEENILDLNAPVRRTQEAAAEAAGQPVGPGQDFYQAKRLMAGTVPSRKAYFKLDYLKPLNEEAKAAGLTLQDIGEYLLAMHADERNARMDQIDPNNNGRGSGISHDEAEEILRSLGNEGKIPALEQVARRVAGIREFILNTAVDAGNMHPDQADEWRNMYQHYADLSGFEDPDISAEHAKEARGSGAGPTISVRGAESKHAFGRPDSVSENPLVNLVNQAYRAIERAERNNAVATAWRWLSSLPPDVRKAIATLDKGPAVKRLDPETGTMRWGSEQGWQMRNDVLAFKIGGKPHYIAFKDKRLGEAAARLAPDALWHWIRHWGSFINLSKSMWTHYNPEFVVRHFMMRYPFEALANAGEDGISSMLESIKGYPGGPMMRAVLAGDKQTAPERAAIAQKVAAGTASQAEEYQHAYHTMRDAGGLMKFSDFGGVAQIKKRLDRELASLDGTAKGAARAAAAKARAFHEYVDHITSALDNAQRLAAFVSAKRRGMSDRDAAMKAREATIDFALKGRFGNYLNIVYPFGNTAAQTASRMVKAARRSGNMRRTIAALMALGAAEALYNYLYGGNDPKDGKPYYEKVQEWTRRLSLVVMTPFKDAQGHPYAGTLALPYNHAFTIMSGVAAVQLALRALGIAKEPVSDILHNLMHSGLEALTPMANENTLLGKLIPFDPARPFYHVAINENFFGGHIHTPYEQKGLARAEQGQEKTPEFWKSVAKGVNNVTGGSRYEHGYVDRFPEDYREIFGYTTSAFERMATHIANSAHDIKHGRAPSVNDIPLARAMVTGDQAYDQADAATYYKDRAKAFDAEAAWKKARKEGNQAEADRMYADNKAEITAAGAYHQGDSQRRSIRHRLDMLHKDKTITGDELDRREKALRDEDIAAMNHARDMAEKRRKPAAAAH